MKDILVRIPEGIDCLIDEIKQVKTEQSEPTTRKAIVSEAVKIMHKKICKNVKA